MTERMTTSVHHICDCPMCEHERFICAKERERIAQVLGKYALGISGPCIDIDRAIAIVRGSYDH